jgi:hypothetical protein
MNLLDNFRYPTKQVPTHIACFQIVKEHLGHSSARKLPHRHIFSGDLESFSVQGFCLKKPFSFLKEGLLRSVACSMSESVSSIEEAYSTSKRFLYNPFIKKNLCFFKLFLKPVLLPLFPFGLSLQELL